MSIPGPSPSATRQGITWVALTVVLVLAAVVSLVVGNVPATIAFAVLAILPAIPAQAFVRRRRRRRS